MKSFKKTSKWFLIALGIITILYSLLWISITHNIANELTYSYAGKKFQLSEDATLSFSKVKSYGFPFKLAVEFENFTEENETNLIIHKSPFRLGYNLLTQSIFTEYRGDSITRYKPLNSGFGARIEGIYNVEAHIPFNMTLLKILLFKSDPVEMINFVNYFNIKSRDVHIFDLSDNSQIIGDADMDIKFSIKHHEYYDSMEELISDIPNDYHFSFSTKTTDAAPGRKPVPFSMIYWTYLPTDFSYEIDFDIHTDARQFSTEDILRNFTMKTNKMDFYSKAESSKSSFFIQRKEVSKDESETVFDYKTKLKLGPEFKDYIAKSIISTMRSIPNNSPLYILKEYLKRIDISAVDFNHGEDEIEIVAKANLHQKAKNLVLDIDQIGLSFKDRSFDLKTTIRNDMKGEWMNGIIQLNGATDSIPYLVGLTSKAYKSYSKPVIFGDKFWSDLYLDYLQSIANSYNAETDNILLEFKINDEVDNARLGRFSTPEANMIYYTKLYKHLKTRTSNQSETIRLFRMMIPPMMDSPEILTRIASE